MAPWNIGMQHSDFLRRATGTDADPAWYGQEVVREVQTGTGAGRS